jgi:hypothetical protein
MPNRIIRENCRTSPNLNGVSPEAERLFWRQITAADDYGCFDADPRVMLAQCFPLLVDRITVDQVRAWRDECIRADLMKLYEAKGRIYGHFPTWFDHQREARSKRKHPAPPRRPAAADPPQDIVVPPRDDHNAPQPAAVRGDPPLGVVSRESLVVSRESRIESRESGNGPPAAEEPLSSVTPQQRRENLRRLREMAAGIGRSLP